LALWETRAPGQQKKNIQIFIEKPLSWALGFFGPGCFVGVSRQSIWGGAPLTRGGEKTKRADYRVGKGIKSFRGTGKKPLNQVDFGALRGRVVFSVRNPILGGKKAGEEVIMGGKKTAVAWAKKTPAGGGAGGN